MRRVFLRREKKPKRDLKDVETFTHENHRNYLHLNLIPLFLRRRELFYDLLALRTLGVIVICEKYLVHIFILSTVWGVNFHKNLCTPKAGINKWQQQWVVQSVKCPQEKNYHQRRWYCCCFVAWNNFETAKKTYYRIYFFCSRSRKSAAEQQFMLTFDGAGQLWASRGYFAINLHSKYGEVAGSAFAILTNIRTQPSGAHGVWTNQQVCK